MNSGLNFKAPWPIEGVWEADTRVQKDEADAAAASADLQDVRAKLAVNYHLERGQVSEIYKEVGPKYKERIIDPAVQETFKAATARYTASDLITKRNQVKDDVRKQLEERMGKRGIKVDDVSIVNFSFSQAFDQAIEQKQVAAQEAERARFNFERAQLDAQSQNVQKGTLSGELLRKQELDNQRAAIEKWNGGMPQYVGAGAVFNIPLAR